MVAWRCKLKRRLVWMLSLMAVTSVVMVVRVHLSQVRKQKAEFILNLLGSRNTSEFVSPSLETVLVDSTTGWIAQRALDSYQGLEKLVQEKRLVVREVRTQPEVPQPPFVLIVVMSEFGFQANRRAIRQTWYKWARRENAKVVFFLGLPSHENVTMGEIEKEIRRYNDIIVDDHADSYYLLSVKVLRILKWFKSTYPPNSRPSFLVKTDHDVFNHVPNLVRHLKGVTPNSAYIGGLLHTEAPVMRDGYSKWYTPPELWNEEYFPPYVGGPCYILAAEVVPLIYEAALKEKLFHLEDVFLTGIIPLKYLSTIKVQGVPEHQILQSDKKLRMYDSNIMECLSFHPVSPTMMHQYYKRARRYIWS